MRFLDADVKKPLAAVSAMVDAGNTVVFKKSGSYVEEDATGERIGLVRKGNTYVMKLGKGDEERKTRKGQFVRLTMAWAKENVTKPRGLGRTNSKKPKGLGVRNRKSK